MWEATSSQVGMGVGSAEGQRGGRGPGQCRARCRQGQRGCLAAAPRQFQAFSASLRSRSPRGTDASHRPSETRPLLPRYLCAAGLCLEVTLSLALVSHPSGL